MIYIDLTGLCGRNWTGVEKYGEILFRMMKEKFGNSQVCALIVGPMKLEGQVYNLGKTIGRLYTEYVLIPKFVFTHKNDTIFFPIFPPAKICWFFSSRLIPVIHDVVPWKFSDTMSWKARMVIVPRMKSALKNAKKIITVSETEKKELQKLNPNPEYIVIYNAFDNCKKKSIFEQLDVQKKAYILSVSTLEPRKNFNYVLQVIDDLFDKINDMKIIIVGRLGWGEIEYQPRNKNRFIFSGYVTDTDLQELYKNANFFITLPIDEGFGRTPVEAAIQGIPIVVSDIPIFHEVLGDNCMYLPLDNVDIAAKKLEEFLLKDNIIIPDSSYFDKYNLKSVIEMIPDDYFGDIKIES